MVSMRQMWKGCPKGDHIGSRRVGACLPPSKPQGQALPLREVAANVLIRDEAEIRPDHSYGTTSERLPITNNMTSDSLDNIGGFLFDLNGVIYDDDRPIDGAVETIERLKAKTIPYRFTTNTTTCSLESLHRKLVAMGLPIEREEIFTVTRSAAAYLRRQGKPTLHLLVNEDTKKDFADFPMSREKPDFVVVGEIGNRWTYDMLNEAFHMMLGGAALMALHKGKYWQVEGKLRLGIGAFVSGLEYATGKQAIVIGKPSPSFFQAPLDDMALPANEVAMVGDDIESDIGGAQQEKVGMKGILVKTGKYRQHLVAASRVKPDLIIDSVAALKDLL